MDFEKNAHSFRQYHASGGNVLIHLMTTPGMFVFLYVLSKNYVDPVFIIAANVVHMLLVWSVCPRFITLLTCLQHVGIVFAALKIDLDLMHSTIGFLICFFGQDLGHFITGEPTFLSTYMSFTGGLAENWLRLLLEHTVFLTPLVWDAFCELEYPLIAMGVEVGNVFYSKSLGVGQQADMKTVREWTRAQGEAVDHTIHHWFSELPKNIYNAYDRLAKSEKIFGAFRERYPARSYNIEILEGMNEIYQTAPDHYSSDRVFYNQHVDGPWCFFPGCYVFRALLSMTENTNIKTIFPLERSHFLLKTGDCIAFDFNREIHYIEAIRKGVHESRIALKLHYVVYPKILMPLGKFVGWLTTMYDQIARWWFLQNLTPDVNTGKFGTWLTLAATYLTYQFHFKIGAPNVVRLVTYCLIEKFVCPGAFLYLSSYVHYGQYIGTYYYRQGVNYGQFLRTATVFKVIATIQLVWLYIDNFEYNPISIGLIAVGGLLAFSSSRALGKERTLFGQELGHLEEKWIDCFPYNLGIPHPMITGALIYLLGIGLMPKIQENYPFYVPLHMFCYTVHMIQEHFDIHYGRRVFTSPKPKFD